MTKKKPSYRFPRIKRNRDGTIAVIGIDPQDLSAVFTSAWLYRHEYEQDQKEKGHKPCDLDAAHFRRFDRITQLLKPPGYVCAYRDKPLSTLAPHQIAVRRRDAKLEAHFRKETKRIIDDIMTDMALRKATATRAKAGGGGND